jgi:23S rRNA (adenine2503-C2)-methyltransferase
LSPRRTLCVSSQVGCGMGCKFCRTGTMGYIENLTTADIIAQVLTVTRDLMAKDEVPFTNIVFMGMGEPLHNYRAVVDAVNILTDPLGFNFGARKITVSTVGLVPAIEAFGKETTVNLAVSVNATTDEVRSKIMPINRKYPLAILMDTLKQYPGLSKRRKVTIEYVMLAGINDTEADMKRLPKLLVNIPSKVNLIPYNENAGLGFKAPTEEHIQKWQRYLLKHNLDVTVRWSKGRDIDAACGQLRTEALQSERLVT